jgi:predicted metal-dependent phosphoesterase TrpH
MRTTEKEDPSFLRVDFHTHTIFSSDSLTTPKKLVQTARRKGIDRVVVTDHNKIEGAIKAKEIDPEIIIVGEEIDTTEGEILAFFVRDKIPPGLRPHDVIHQLREQGAFISISHPFDPMRKGSWNLKALVEILPFIDAIETFNARCMRPVFNWRAEAFARDHQLLGTHGSDAHAAFEIGRGSLILPYFGETPSLKDALRNATSPRLVLSAPWVHLTSRFAVWMKKITKR